MKEVNISRRNLLGLMVIGATAPAFGASAYSSSTQDATQDANQEKLTFTPLRLFNIHTKEHLVIRFDEVSLSDNDVQRKINHFLRDHRENAEFPMDTKLLVQLHQLQLIVGGGRAFEVIAGYRTKATNELLRKRSRAVSKKSYHMQGRAIDVRLPGTKTHRLRTAAISMRAGGVGYYARSNFIHVDTASVRYWEQL